MIIEGRQRPVSTTHAELFDSTRSDEYVEILADLRHNDPLFFFEGDSYRTWVVTRYDDIKALLKDERLIQPSLEPRIASFTDEQRAQLQPLQDFARDNLGRTRERKHALREATKPFFMPASVDRLRGRVREIIEVLLKQVDPTGPVDLVGSFSFPMPAWVLAEILGVPREDQGRFIDWSEALIRYFRSYTFDEFVATQPKVVEMLDYCAEHIERRAGAETFGDDLVDVFARLLAEGQFEIGELSSSCATFLMAGHENTSHFIGNLLETLYAHRDVLESVKRDFDMLPRVMNETMRFHGVVPFVTREVLEDMDFAGHRFERGQLVSLSLFSANRDEGQFGDVDRFDPDNRAARHHLGFGHGEEYCRGAHLALMETRELIEFMLTRFPDMEPVEGGMETRCQPMLRRYVTRFDVMLNAG